MEKYRDAEWEIKNSSLYHKTLLEILRERLTLKECRDFACHDIVNNLTKINPNKKLIHRLNDKFSYLIRVDTNYSYDVDDYYHAFRNREFMSFSTITEKNLSHYKNHGRNYFFAYNLPSPDCIAHIFPCDSDTKTSSKTEEELTKYPSMWLTLDELNALTKELEVYNQLTIRTKYDGEIIKPSALIVVDNLTDEAKEVAQKFNLNPTVVPRNKDTIYYDRDLLYDEFTLGEVSYKMKKKYGIDFIENSFYPC